MSQQRKHTSAAITSLIFPALVIPHLAEHSAGLAGQQL